MTGYNKRNEGGNYDNAVDTTIRNPNIIIHILTTA